MRRKMERSNKSNVVAVIQARMSSSRLPGKVLQPILGRPMLDWMIERVKRSRNIDQLVLATSREESDNPLAEYCQDKGIECFRGSLDDVLDRFYQAALQYRADHIVRLTADCPLLDPALLDQVIALHLDGSYDISCSGACDTFPDGMDVSVVTFAALARTWQEAVLPSEREHVTSYMFNHPERYLLGVVHHTEKLGHWRWSVDEPEDFDLVSRIFAALCPVKSDFGFADICAFIRRNPEVLDLNRHIIINAGYQKSLAKDEEYLREQRELNKNV
ncbi:MAG TPA: glycosyltransferase family protein [Patescibacteria group bacterium]|nr:glycosyltransferase family protein [Patescibacteria group bacterium]